MPTVDLGIDAGALTRLTELPDQILSAVAAAQQALDGADPAGSGNAIADLVAGLGALPDQLAELPDLGPALADLGALRELVPAELPAAAEAALSTLHGVTDALAPLAPLIDDPEAFIEAATQRLSGLTAAIATPSDASLGVGGELAQFFTLLNSLDDWTTRAPSATEVASLVAKAFVGADLDLLAPPLAALQRCLARLDTVLPDGADLTRWRTGLTGLQATWTALDAAVTAPQIDWRAIEVDLSTAARVQAELISARDRLLADAVAALGGLEFGGLADVAAAIRAIPQVPEVRLTPLLDGFVDQMRGLRNGLEHWELSADQVRAIVRAMMLQLKEAIDNSALGALRRGVLSFEQRILAVVDELPLRDIADELTGVLDGMAGAVDDVDLAGLLSPVTELGDSVGSAISALAGNAVRETVEAVWNAVESALQDAAAILEQLRAALAAVTGQLGEFSSRVGPAVAELVDAVTTLKVTLEDFDLTQPTAAVLDNLHRARDTVAAIDVSVLPADAVQLVHDAAGALADIDITSAIREPIAAVLDAVDPGPLLHTVLEVLTDIGAQLAAVDPSTLIATLDAPVGTVLDGLAELDPSRLESMIDDAVAPVRQAIAVLDAHQVLEPATATFADLMNKLDGLLDPAPVFEPLQQAYQPIIDAVEALDPSALLDLIGSRIGGVTENFGDAAGAAIGPKAVTGGKAGLAGLPTSVDVDADDLFGFRPGDLLVPLIDLHHRLMSALQGLTGDVLDRAAEALNRAFTGGMAELRPDVVFDRIDATLARVSDELGATVTASAIADAVTVYQRVSARLAVAGRAAAGDDASVALRVNAVLPSIDPMRLIPGPGQTAALSAAAVAARRADVTALRSAYAVGVSKLRRLLPALVGDAQSGAGLLGALAALDPAPIRVEVNALFDEAGQFLAGLGDVVTAAMEEAAAGMEAVLSAFSLTGLFDMVTHVHQNLVAQVVAISPAVLAEHVRLVFAAVRRQLEALDPGQLAEQVDAIRVGLDGALDQLLDGLLPDPAPLRELQTRLAALRPSQLLAPVTAALAPITTLTATVDADALMQPLVGGIDRIKEQLPVVIAQLEAAFDEVLRAFPTGGVSGASGSVSASASIG
jgi:hypothetical protein